MGFEVFRDALGVPHVRASDELALAHGQGWVTARDRAWQVQTDRWRAEGRLAEHLGDAGVAWDVVAHRLRLPDTAQRAYAALGADDRAWVDAYTAGVNAGLASAGPPAEVAELDRVLGGTTPDDPWPAWAPLGVFLVNHALFSTFPRVLWHDHVARTARESGHAGLAAVDPLDLVRLFDPASDGPTSGSNAWALHGSRTASGAPLLAGDPHRVLELPGVYQQIRLACPEYDVLGLAFPGVPGLPHFGHAGSAAWGITNAAAHAAEVFRERLRRTGGGAWEALGPDGWEPVEHASARVRVRGGEPLTVDVLETGRGPVVVRGMPADADGAPAGERRDGPGQDAGPAPDLRAGAGQDDVTTGAVPRATVEEARSVRMQTRVDADLGFASLRPLLRARTARDVAAALAGWVDPVNRVVAADADGTVLTFDAGRVADRPREERLLPLHAWEAAHAPRPWRTLAAPRVVTDAAVDANEWPSAPDRDHGSVYAPDRAVRLRALLADRRDRALGPGDMAEIHADTHWAGAGRLLRHVAGVDGLTPAAGAVRDRLLAWDLHMDADSPEAALLADLRAVLVGRLVAEPAIAALAAPHRAGPAFDAWFGVRGRVGAALAALLDRTDLGIDGPAHVRAALEEVAAAATPGDHWGARHTVLPAHVLADVPGAAVPAVPALPLAGDQDTVRCTGTVPGVTDRAFRGSVARWVWDLGDRARSRWGVPFGTSGDPRSPHFADQHATWAVARTVEVVTDWDALTPEPLPAGAGE
ncbi:penicillin acylase family protein [Cellulomonas shaoxiangyii]|uniref:Penicillin acylase family protein n=1 Tax=Cellulomonas shaoxiangyii TaxID=2566013 RepID=A0A4P7SKV8_9CELL|nr:penicillin acylase family protein [Cellulomonas shaoxiangyii]QCB94852.1 penicillin acylase family protein [Cellulomonas shaoxiangyii]TGY82020.1 penicillin acylase family protein [Cellulomonas shaoxiangyii]